MREEGLLHKGKPVEEKPKSPDGRLLERVLLRDLGIDKHLSSRAQRLAELPDEEFETLLAQIEVGAGADIERMARGVLKMRQRAGRMAARTPRAPRMAARSKTSMISPFPARSSTRFSPIRHGDSRPGRRKARRHARDDRCLSMPRSRSSTRSNGRASRPLGRPRLRGDPSSAPRMTRETRLSFVSTNLSLTNAIVQLLTLGWTSRLARTSLTGQRRCRFRIAISSTSSSVMSEF